MKKIISALSFALLLTCLFALTGCGPKSEELCLKRHTFAEWVTVIEANCTEDGSRTHTCSSCTKIETEIITKTGHEFIQHNETQSTICLSCGTVNVHEDEISSMLYEDGLNYYVKFKEDTTIAALNTLLRADAKSFNIQLFQDAPYSLTETLNIKTNVTIDGNGAVFTSALANVFVVTSNDFEVRNITINSSVGTRVISIVTNGNSNVVVEYLVANLPKSVISRGITYGESCENSNLTVNECQFFIGTAEFYETNAVYGSAARGISLWNTKNATIIVTNSKFKGFSYAINIDGVSIDQVIDSTGGSILIDNCEITGWNAMNIWASGMDITIKNSKLKGINNLTTPTNSFGIIVINNDLYGTYHNIYADNLNFTIDNCQFTTYQNEIAKAGTETECFIRINKLGSSKFNISNSFFTDLTGKQKGIFQSRLADEDFNAYLDVNVTLTNVVATTINVEGESVDIPRYGMKFPVVA